MLDQSPPIDPLSGRLLPRLAQNPCYGRLMGLLVQFRKVQRTDMIVPPVHIGSIEEHVEKVHIESLRDRITFNGQYECGCR